MTFSNARKFLVAGYRRRALLFVSIVSFTFTVFIISIFFYKDHQHKQMDDARTVKAVSKILSESIRLPMYANNKEEIQKISESAIETFHVSKIRIVHPDGTPYFEFPTTSITSKMATSHTPIVISQKLDPETIISGGVPKEIKLGVVIVSTKGEEREREMYLTLTSLSIGGFVLWIFTTYIGYIIMRNLTKSFDNLVVAIQQIELGKSETIEIRLQDEAQYIAKSINRLSQTLHDRERQNLALQQKLTQQMEQRAEQAEQTMHAKLIHADKMASLGMLVGCMGHEINNPNAMIRLHIEFLKKVALDVRPIIRSFAEDEIEFSIAGFPYLEADRMIFESIDSAYNQTVRIERVISELRNFATADSREKSLIGLDKAVFGTMVLLNPQLKQYEGKIVNMVDKGNKRTDSTDLVYTNPDRRAKVLVNQYSLQQVIVNLLLNAIRATKEKGKDGSITLQILSYPDTVQLKISDNGVGIRPDDISKLCDPYFSRNMGSGGTGLGLFIAKQILDDHKATIEFNSELGSGTAIHLMFPAIRFKETD